VTTAGPALSPAAEATASPGLPAVDVVIDNYNYGRFLAAAITSALEQTHTRVTVIVVDDGSDDDSRGVIESFGDRVVPVLKENGGQASAFNAGLERSGGDVVVFLDADDMLAPDAALRVAELFARQPDLAKVHYRLAVVDEEGTRTGEILPSPHIPLPRGDLRTAMTRFPFDLARPGTSGNAFSARVLREIAPVPTGWRTAADWYVVYLAALYGPVGAIDDALGFYRVHGGNWHASDSEALDVEHVRATIARTRRARSYLEEAAVRLGLPWDPRDASMCEVADRAISRKLDPAHHPVEGDTPAGLVRLGARAAARRFDVGVPMRAAFVAWLVALTLTPRPLARTLAELFVLPERRGGLNRWLGRLHRRR
jgi:glycosyl transferase family 2